MASDRCDLCGLPLRFGSVTDGHDEEALRFCCPGCRMVYAMLLEAADARDPARFRETDLFRQCVAAGVIPASEDDLARLNSSSQNAGERSVEGQEGEHLLPLHLVIEGMWCPACAWVIQHVLTNLKGVAQARCDFATDRLHCRYDPRQTGPEAVLSAVRKLGYAPTAADDGTGRSRQREFIRLTVTALLSANVMMLSWALYSGFFDALNLEDIRSISCPILVMAAVVMIYGGGPLFRKAWWGVRAGAPGMETLVSMGAGSAFLYSLYNFAANSWHLYFDTAGMLITLVLLGKMLETGAKRNVRRDLEGFLSLQPNKVRLCSAAFPDGRFTAGDQLRPGDGFRVCADEILPADGRVASGKGVLDESTITGESLPRSVGPGDRVTSGARLVSGDIAVTARRVGADAMLGQMIEVIRNSLERRTPLETRSDRWLALFVPVMAGLATATVVIGHVFGLTWEQAFVRGLTVMVIACPCALGIAIPLTRVAGISKAARQGILIRDFEAFERAGQMDCIVFDKTGTITHGRWALEQIVPHGGMPVGEAAALAAGLERGVDHAVARAVMEYVRAGGIEPAVLTEVGLEPGGVRGRCQGREACIGTWDFVSDQARPDGEQPSIIDDLRSDVFLSLDRSVVATLSFGDALRPGVVDLLSELRTGGYGIHLISGDTQAATHAVAALLPVDNALGELLPADKAELVARLQSEGRRVVMVGDGINDAPALARADLAVAVHRDASLAHQAAEVILMRGDPAQLMDFFRLATAVNAKVSQNLICAWMYNLVSIPIAMSGLLNPLIAATAMLLSSLTVIGNTLLLARRR
jgi:heavy metal translocating P-type ATPase